MLCVMNSNNKLNGNEKFLYFGFIKYMYPKKVKRF